MLMPLVRQIWSVLPDGTKSFVRRNLAERRTAKARTALASAGVGPLEQPDFNHLLHYLRGQELSSLPKGVDRFVSVGCAGIWYFDWIEKCCGPINRHIGIEYYTPMPEGLAANVEWIANTAGDMSLIADDTGDILFSGQNLEHLWPGDVAAFLRESHRVLKTGGLLVVDSPNRLVTQKLCWSHPEHTVELTPDEARKLIEASGFDVTALRGMWRCSSGAGTVVPLDRLESDGQWSVANRINDAFVNPDDSFSWWIEARKTDRAPDNAEVIRQITAVFSRAWPERVNRLLTLAGKRVAGGWIESAGVPGVLMYGPYMPLPAGHYTAGFELRAREGLEAGATAVMRVDVVAGAGTELACRTLDASDFNADGIATVALGFQLDDMTFGIQFRAIANGNAQLAVRSGVSLTCAGDPTLNVRLAEQPAG
ncbi:MAG: methyltransferase domain-containing protein [Pseudomonadota bacterium]